MFKSQNSVLLTGLAVYIVYIVGFILISGLSLGFMFYVAAFFLFAGFLLYISDFYPESEVVEMTKSPSDSAKYKSDESYCVTSIAAIFLLLLSVTPLLVLLLLKQNGTFDSGWLIRVLAFFGGYLLLNLISVIYHIGNPYTVGSLVSYNNTMINAPSSTTTMKDVLDGLDEICTWAPSETVREAKGILKEVFIKTQNAYEHEIVNSARLSDDLGVCDLLEVSVILTEIDEILGKKYGKHLYDLVHADYESAEKRRFIEWDKRYSTAIMLSKSENKPIDSDVLYKEFISIFPKFLDLTHFLAEAIHSFRRR